VLLQRAHDVLEGRMLAALAMSGKGHDIPPELREGLARHSWACCRTAAVGSAADARAFSITPAR
jgi:hypothetical protein